MYREPIVLLYAPAVPIRDLKLVEGLRSRAVLLEGGANPHKTKASHVSDALSSVLCSFACASKNWLIAISPVMAWTVLRLTSNVLSEVQFLNVILFGPKGRSSLSDRSRSSVLARVCRHFELVTVNWSSVS